MGRVKRLSHPRRGRIHDPSLESDCTDSVPDLGILEEHRERRSVSSNPRPTRLHRFPEGPTILSEPSSFVGPIRHFRRDTCTKTPRRSVLTRDLLRPTATRTSCLYGVSVSLQSRRRGSDRQSTPVSKSLPLLLVTYYPRILTQDDLDRTCVPRDRGTDDFEIETD